MPWFLLLPSVVALAPRSPPASGRGTLTACLARSQPQTVRLRQQKMLADLVRHK